MSNDMAFHFQGYTDLSQIGRYHAVTIRSQKTRLYTMVNFLQPRNIRLMEQASMGKTKVEVKKIDRLNTSDLEEGLVELN